MRVLLACVLPTSLLAAEPSELARSPWQSIGPAPPAVEAAVVADPGSGTVVVASAGGGVLRSGDRGATFVAANQGLDGIVVTALAMRPDDPRVLYLSNLNDVYKSADGGQSWQATHGMPSVVTIAIAPGNPDVLYTGSSPNGGVARSTDGGTTWAPANTGMGVPPVFALAVDPRDPGTVYAGTNGAGAYKSVDFGAHWQPLQVDPTVWAWAIDPGNPQVLYAATNGAGVMRSLDAGASWMRIGSPGSGFVLSLALVGPILYAGTATGGVWASDDGGSTWRNTGVSSGLGLVLSVDPAGNLYAGTNFDGAFVLRNRREQDDEREEFAWRRLAWGELRRCPCQNGHAIAIDPADHLHLLLSTNDGGLLATHDGGRRWHDGGTHGLVARAPRGLAFDPRDPRRVYAGAFTGTGFFKSEDGGRTWRQRVFGSAATYTTGVTVDPADQSVYVATLSGDGIWKSMDYGETFTRVDRAPGAAPGSYLNLAGRGITADPQVPGRIYAAASRGKNAGIWRSVDAGASWVRVDPTPTLSVTVDPTNSGIVYAATPGPAVRKSSDGGQTFSSKSAGLATPFQTSRTGSVQVDPRRPTTLYVGTEGGGVYKSIDGAESWAPVNLGLDNLNVYGIALDAAAPDTLYVTTDRSIYRTTTGGE